MEQKGVYTLQYLVDTYNLDIRNLRESIAKGELIGSKVGKQYFVTEGNFVKWVESKKVDTTKKKAKAKGVG